MQSPSPLRPQLLALLSALLLASPAALAQKAPEVAQASALPTARVEKISLAIDGDSLILKDESTSQRFLLKPLAAAVFALSDGKTSPAEMRKKLPGLTGYSASEESVFAALDALADAKLLLARVTPPGTVPTNLVVLIDGSLGSALVESTSKEGTPKKRQEALTQEESFKKKLAPARHQEEDAKLKSEELTKKSEARVVAVKKFKEADSKKGEAENKKGAAKQNEQSAKVSSLNVAKESAAKEAQVRTSENQNKAINLPGAKQQK